MTPIQSPHAPRPAGHYAQAIQAGGFLFVSGQLPIDPATGRMIQGSLEDEMRQALANVRAVLEAAGLSLNAVVKTTVYVCGVENWPRVNQVYAEIFGAHRPARSIVPCPSLHHGALVEIEVIALCSP